MNYTNCKSLLLASIVVLAILLWNNASAQKHDRIWCFGYQCGIDFNDTAAPQIFQPKTSNGEISASIADSAGNLLLYIGTDVLNARNDIMGANHAPIVNGHDIETTESSARGAIIIPTYRKNQFFVFHSSFPICDSTYWCGGLYYALVNVGENGIDTAIKRDVKVFDESIEEGLSCVKHANGRDWWLIVHDHRTDNEPNCTQRFFKFLIEDTLIRGPFIQDIGKLHCSHSYPGGEPRFSVNGNVFSFVSMMNNWPIDIFNFNRCNGELTSLALMIGHEPYSSEFSPDGRFLYVSEGINGSNYQGELNQYDLTATNVASSKVTLWQENDSKIMPGQLQLAPDGKIYVAIGTSSSGSGMPSLQDSLLHYISVINHPDSAGLSCDFEPFSFYLGDSSRCYVNLPNIPNYNLGALSIYQADAGSNQIFCKDDTTTTGILIGSPAVAGVQYRWFPSWNLTDTDINASMPFITPDTSRWYYLELTDTTIKNSCQSRIDSVFVEVRNCDTTTGYLEPEQSFISIYPNPTDEKLYITSLIPNYQLQSIIIMDLSGRSIVQTTETEVSVIDLKKGIYFIKVELTDGRSVIRKIVVDK